MTGWGAVGLIWMVAVPWARAVAGEEGGSWHLTYEEALDIAVKKNPELVQSGLDQRSAEGALLAARGIYDPMLGTGLNRYMSTGETIREFGELSSDTEVWSSSADITQLSPTGTSFGLEWTV
ncbi:MAG: hypothetical protein QGG40_18665, partial [Myxococcota bacterium]|nr:hypothetical protein [Myxococcota bacterium]